MVQWSVAEVIEVEPDVIAITATRAMAVVAVVAVVVGLAVLPVAVGLGLAPEEEVIGAMAGAGGLLAVVGGVKSGAVVWGLLSRGLDRPGLRTASASVD